MPKVAVYNMQGQQVGDIDLRDDIFGVSVNQSLLHQAVVMYQANKRQGTVKTKTRAEVRGGGRKPWRQKGTGRARHGSTRSPVWVGGGTTFGPQPRDYRQKMPKKARRAALKSALSSKVGSGNFVVVEDVQLDEPKTRVVVEMLKALNVDRKALLVTPETEPTTWLASRNIPGVDTTRAADLNAFDVLAHDKVVLTKDAVSKVEEVLG